MLFPRRSPRPIGVALRAAVLSASCLLALIGLSGCSASDIHSVWIALQASAGPDAGGGGGGCLRDDPVLSDKVEPAAVLRWTPEVCAVFDAADASTALCVISYESGGDPNAMNLDDPGRGSFGLMQINSDWWIGSEYHERMVNRFGREDETYLDPVVNVAAAALLVNDPDLSGWHSWASSRLCPHEHPEQAT